MPLYYYKALTQENEKVIEGQMNAASDKAVSSRLQQIGYLPIIITKADEQSRRIVSLFSNDISSDDVVFFTSKLALTLKAGLALDESLELLNQTTESKRLIQLLGKVTNAIQDGITLSDALEQNSGAFDRFYLNTLRAGELSGTLQHVLSDLTDYLEHQQRLKRSLVSALIYPAILLCVTLATLIILLLYVVPQFQLIFEQMGQTLPLSTQIVISASQLLADHGWKLALFVIVAIFLLKNFLKDDVKRQPVDKLILRLPLIAEAVIRLETARFSRTMATLLSNGVPMLASLDVVIESLNNTVLRKSVVTVRDGVQRGQRLSSAMKQQRVFPPMAVQLVHVGEETGELGSMLRQVSDIYDTELKETIDRILVLLEPAIIIGLGVTVAAIIISVLLAILSLNDFVV